MQNRVIIAALAMLTAAILGFTAPEPSTAINYRLIVFFFVGFSIAYRALTMGSMAPAVPGLNLSAPFTSTRNRITGGTTSRAAPAFSLPILV